MNKTLPFLLLCAAGAITAQDYYTFNYDATGNTTSIRPYKSMPFKPDTLIVDKDFSGKINVKITPNPTEGAIDVFVNGLPESSEMEIGITSPSGQRIYQTTTTEPRFAIDITGQTNGIYLLEVKADSASAIYKFIKK